MNVPSQLTSYSPQWRWHFLWESKLFLPRIGTRHTHISRPVWISPQLRNIVYNHCNNDLSVLSVKIGHHAITIIDHDKKIISRIASDPLGYQKISTNYIALTSNRLPFLPQPIQLNPGDSGVFFSQETMVPGNTIMNIYAPQHYIDVLPNILGAVCGMYKKLIPSSTHAVALDLLSEMNELAFAKQASLARLIHKLKTILNTRDSALATATIHGDLNLSNVLKDKKTFYFVDFENSSLFFPEYDCLLLSAYALNFQKRQPTYEFFLDRFIDQKEKNHSRGMRSLLPKAYVIQNRDHTDFISFACVCKLMIDLKKNLTHDQATFARIANHFSGYA